MNKPIVIKATNLVEKRNILNEMKSTYFTMQEARIFAIYLSKINPRNLETRVVKFKLEDFLAIVNIHKMNISKLIDTTNKLLSIIINIPDDNGGYSAFQLFKKCKVYKDNENNEWYFEIDAHDEALPLMFDFQDKYFTYQVGNILRLNSPNQMRMYEMLKQYEHFGKRILSVDKVKENIGIQKDEYPRFGDFKIRVLDACQRSLAEYTDIKFTYEPYGKKGKGGKILFLKFTIKKNKDYIDQLTLDKFIEQNKEVDEEATEGLYENRIKFLCDACDNEFLESEIIVLYNLMVENLSCDIISEDLRCYDYLMRKYHELKMRNDKNKITHRFAYMKSLIGTD